jgi:hypothetical protein
VPDSNLADTSVLTSTFYNTYLREQVVVTCTSATRPTGVEGRHIYETDTDLVYVYNGTGWEQVGGTGGWTSYTPQIDQGVSTNIAKTTNYAKWMRGPRRTITCNFYLTLTAGGTAGSNVTVTLPVTAASSSAAIGGGQIFDNSTSTRYAGSWVAVSTTQLTLVHDGGGGSGWGVLPNLAIASSDQLQGTIVYEAAT